MKNLAFHSLHRWKMIILPILTTPLIRFSWQGYRRMCFLSLGFSTPPSFSTLLPSSPAGVCDNSLALDSFNQGPPFVCQFKHGQSNPTYYIEYGGKKLVLRKKPVSTLHFCVLYHHTVCSYCVLPPNASGNMFTQHPYRHGCPCYFQIILLMILCAVLSSVLDILRTKNFVISTL